MLDERSLRELAGHPVVDREGKSVGYVDQIFNDDQTGAPEWIGVITGTFRHHVHLVPASGIGQEDGTLRVQWTKDQVHNAPGYGGGDQRGILGLAEYRPAISEAKEREAYAHYGLTETK